MLVALKHNLSQLFVFSGRTRPLHFWLYTAVVIMAGWVTATIGGVRMMQDMFGRMGRFMREHPDQVTVTQTSGGTSWNVEGYHPELVPDFQPFIVIMAVVSLSTVLLLAAAVTRRLHDSDRRGWWGLLPLPFLATAFALFPTLFTSGGGEDPDMTLFLLLFANNLVYLICLGLLVALLCLNGTRGENRFGPPPV
ncbi:MAG: DUF805 domain-containing protein [Sphingomonas sp.]